MTTPTPEHHTLSGLINIVTGLALGSTGGAVLGGFGAPTGKALTFAAFRYRRPAAGASTQSGREAARHPSGAESNPTTPGQFDIDHQ